MADPVTHGSSSAGNNRFVHFSVSLARLYVAVGDHQLHEHAYLADWTEIFRLRTRYSVPLHDGSINHCHYTYRFDLFIRSKAVYQRRYHDRAERIATQYGE